MNINYKAFYVIISTNSNYGTTNMGYEQTNQGSTVYTANKIKAQYVFFVKFLSERTKI